MRSPLTGLLLLVATPTLAQTGSQGCAIITQASADGANARIQANNQTLNAPPPIAEFTCLDGFFNGTGLNVIANNFLNPGSLLQSIKGQICNAVNTEWQNLVGTAQCGLSVSGFNLGFLGFNGGGLMCPKLSFGGGGPPLGGVYTQYQTGNGNGLYINGQPAMPDGYNAPQQGGIY